MEYLVIAFELLMVSLVMIGGYLLVTSIPVIPM